MPAFNSTLALLFALTTTLTTTPTLAGIPDNCKISIRFDLQNYSVEQTASMDHKLTRFLRNRGYDLALDPLQADHVIEVWSKPLRYHPASHTTWFGSGASKVTFDVRKNEWVRLQSNVFRDRWSLLKLVPRPKPSASQYIEAVNTLLGELGCGQQ